MRGGLTISINQSIKIAGDKHLPPSMRCLPAPSVQHSGSVCGLRSLTLLPPPSLCGAFADFPTCTVETIATWGLLGRNRSCREVVVAGQPRAFTLSLATFVWP